MQIEKKYTNIIIAALVCLYTFLGTTNSGSLGLNIDQFMQFLFGINAYTVYIYIVLLAVLNILFNKEKKAQIWKNKYWNATHILFVATFFTLMTSNVEMTREPLIGVFGEFVYSNLYFLIGNAGIWAITIMCFAVGFYLLFNIHWLKTLKDFIIESNEKSKQTRADKRAQKAERKAQELAEQDDFEFDETDEEFTQELSSKKEPEFTGPDLFAGLETFGTVNLEATDLTGTNKRKIGNGGKKSLDDSPSTINIDSEFITNNDHTEMFKPVKGKYIVPSFEFLDDLTNQDPIIKKLKTSANENGQKVVDALQMYGLKTTLSNITIGPNVTRFELIPQAGTKVNKFTNLSNDLALALAARSIRIEAPIPGKAAVGIELPNKEMLAVSLKDLFREKKNKLNNNLQVPLGKNIAGETVYLEINKTPHMLVAGSTGSGKSVCINSIIISMLLKAKPDQLKLVLIDPKKVELTQFNQIPHLLTPVVTEPKKAAVILNKMVAEMEFRYELFAQTNTRNIESYNEKLDSENDFGYSKLPYIVIVVDELADLMMVAAADVEISIARLAQMARAAGIHLILATQRPSTDVITGLIKANIPTRLSFAVSSSIDSRTILDSTGAEKLLGKGDMLLSFAGTPHFERIQGTYLKDSEIERIVEMIKSQNSEFENHLREQSEFEEQLTVQEEMSELDPYYEDAKEIVIENQSASTSLLQRKLKIGFNRASRLMDQLEENGIISAANGTKPRKVFLGDIDED
ncbi:MAG: DNA translocase FtsK 4TM domain-containing protein [Mycoplasmatales bacterium]